MLPIQRGHISAPAAMGPLWEGLGTSLLEPGPGPGPGPPVPPPLGESRLAALAPGLENPILAVGPNYYISLYAPYTARTHFGSGGYGTTLGGSGHLPAGAWAWALAWASCALGGPRLAAWPQALKIQFWRLAKTITFPYMLSI